MKRSELKEMIVELITEKTTSKVVLKSKEMGEGVPVTIHIDDEGYLVLKDKQGKMIFLHPTQIQQLHRFLIKNKFGLSKVLKPKVKK